MRVVAADGPGDPRNHIFRWAKAGQLDTTFLGEVPTYGANAYTIPDLDPGTYDWQAIVCVNPPPYNNGCSRRLFIGRFQLVAPPVPTVTQAPANGVASGTLTPTFSVNALTLSDGTLAHFDIQLADSPDFTNVLWADTAPSNQPLTVPVGRLRSGQAVYWRVRSVDPGYSEGAWTSAQRFFAYAPPPPSVFGATVRVSQTTAGSGAGGSDPSVSGNGRFVAFLSANPNLVAGDTNGVVDAFISDRQLGTVERVSVGAGATQANGASSSVAVSDDGRFVAFVSTATNLVGSADTNVLADVFVRDRTSNTTERVSVGAANVQANGASTGRVAISADGRYVAFASAASNLLGTSDTNSMADVFVRDRVATPSPTTTRVSVNTAGAQQTAAGGNVVGDVAITPDGRYVAFASTGAGLVTGDTNGRSDIFVRDRNGTGTTQRASVKADGSQAGATAGGSRWPSISADGRFVAFESTFPDLLAGGTSSSDVYLRDRGTTPTTVRVSLGPANVAGNGDSTFPSVSDDGRYVSFSSAASNLVADDTNARVDVFRRDRNDGTTIRVSMSSDDAQGTLATTNTGLLGDASADGRIVAFSSALNGLVASDTDDGLDVFVSDTAIERTKSLPPPVPSVQTLGVCDNHLGGTEAAGCDAGEEETGPTGGYTDSQTDISLPGVGEPFVLSRTYNSLDTSTGLLGPSWATSLQAKLTAHPNGDVVVTGGDGQRGTFFLNNGSYQAEPGLTSTLTWDAASSTYTLTTLDLDKQVFSSSGLLLSSKSERNEGLTYAYDGQNRVTSVTDSAGRVITLTYLASSPTRLERVSLPDGRYIQYGYSAAPDERLTSVRDLRGKVTTYAYYPDGKLQHEVDPRGNYTVRLEYAGARLSKRTDAEGGVTTYGWDAATGTSTRTDPRGKVWTQRFQGNTLVSETDPAGKTTSYGYDAKLNRVLVTNPRGHQTRYAFDARGNMVEELGAAPFSVAESWRYDAKNKLVSQTDRRGATTTHTYHAATGDLLETVDALGGKTTFTYTGRGQVLTEKDERGQTTGMVTTYGYDSAGNRTSTTTPMGTVTRWSYDGSGRKTSETDPRGELTSGNPNDFKTTYTYDDGDQVLTVTDARGNTTTTTYDDNGNPLTVTDRRGKVTSFEYDKNNRRTKVTEPRSPGVTAVSTTEYDADGNVLAAVAPNGQRTTYAYDDVGRRQSMISPRGNVAGANGASFTWTYAYDEVGNPTSVTAPATAQLSAATTTTTFDALNRAVSVTSPLGKVTKTTYDGEDNVLSVTDPLGNTERSEYDALGRKTAEVSARGKRSTMVYDASGDLTQSTSPAGGVTKFFYDEDHRLTSKVEPRGNVAGGVATDYDWLYTYDVAGNQRTVADPLGNTTTTDYDANDNSISVTDARNQVTRFGYDPEDQLTSVTGPDAPSCSTGVQCVAGKASTVYEFDDSGNVITRTDPKGHVTTSSYDLSERLKETVSAIGKKWRYGYDADGNQTSEITAKGAARDYRDEVLADSPVAYWRLGETTGTAAASEMGGNSGTYTGGVTLGQTGALPNSTNKAATFDGVNDYVSVPHNTGLNATTGVTVEVWAKRTKNAAFQVIAGKPGDGQSKNENYALWFDSSNRVTGYFGNGTTYASVTWGTAVDTNWHHIAATYDNATARLFVDGVQVAQATSTVVLTPNALALNIGRAAANQYYFGGSLDELAVYPTALSPTRIQAHYGAAGAGPSAGEAAATITRTYDGRGQLTAVTYGDGTTPNIAYIYDNSGRKTQMTDGAGVESYGYDDADRLLNVTRGTDQFSYGYNPDDQVESRTFPDASNNTATFDDDGRLASVTTGSATTQFAYDAAGNLTAQTLPAGNGYVVTRSYDRAGRVTKAESKKGATNLVTEDRVLDPVGNPTLITTTRTGQPTKTEAFEYDPADRLLRACQDLTACGTAPAKHITWTYDAVGNRQTQNRVGQAANNTNTTYTYNNADQLTQAAIAGGATTAYTYDDNGNQITDGAKTLTYDLENRLTSHTASGTTTSYTYDGTDKRLSKTTGASVTKYSWDTVGGLPELALERTGTGTLIRRYVQGATGPLALQTPSAGYWYHLDVLGSVRALTDSAGVEQWRYDYDPYGEPRATTQVAAGAPANPNQYNGEYLDTESSLYHLRARQYDPSTGRFGALDPVDAPLTDPYVGEYVYAADQPLVAVDPTGERPVYDGGGPAARRTARRVTRTTTYRAPRWVPTPSYRPRITPRPRFTPTWTPSRRPAQGSRAKTSVCPPWCPSKRDQPIGRALKWFGGKAKSAAPYVPVVGQGIAGVKVVRAVARGDVRGALSEGVNVVPGGRYARAGVGGARVALRGGARVCSFGGQTLVLMGDRTLKPISRVRVGDLVVATDPESGEQLIKPVTAVFSHSDTLVDLVIAGQVIATTEDHPFWSVTDGRFEPAGQLAPGERVLAADGRILTATANGSTRVATAYNLAVEGIHTYHAGPTSILVHNTCTPKLVYEANPKHGRVTRPGPKGPISRAPRGDCQAMLNCSTAVSPKLRTGVEPGSGLSVTFRRHRVDPTTGATYWHGFVPGG